jgi:predicted acylesterase/phospholipase RssA
MESPAKRTGLVLSGGGLTGICAQAGAIMALEEKGCAFDTLIGTSAGSVVGGMYALGLTAEQIREKVLDIQYRDYVDPDLWGLAKALLNKLTGWTGVLKGDAFLGWLRDNLGADTLIESCPRDFSVVVTNVSRSWPQVKDAGLLADWIRCSASIPIGFQLAEYEGEYYADGGAVANIAARQLAESGPKEIDQILVVTTLSSKTEPLPDNSFMEKSYTPVREIEQIIDAAYAAQVQGNLDVGPDKQLIYLHVDSTRVDMLDPVGLDKRIATCYDTAFNDAKQQLDNPTGPLADLHCLEGG